MVDFQYQRPYSWAALLEIMRLLRTPEGCPWDNQQTHASIRRNFLEETYEALDALDRDDATDMCEELGDVLLQVVFHAQIEAERGRFTMDDVVDGIAEKLVFRHPHVFGDRTANTSDAALANWEERKRTEKHQSEVADTVEAVPHTLPALWRAEKMVKRASRSETLPERDPVEAVMQAGHDLGAASDKELEPALGNLLFAAAALAQKRGIDPEEALHNACDRFAADVRKAETNK